MFLWKADIGSFSKPSKNGFEGYQRLQRMGNGESKWGKICVQIFLRVARPLRLKKASNVGEREFVEDSAQ